MNMFKTTDAKTPEEYIAKIEEPRRSDIEELYSFIKRILPEEKYAPYIISGMIGFGSYHYKSVSGREGDWCIIGLASQKNYISVYVCAVRDGKYIAEYYKEALPKASIGKSCIRFKKVQDISLDIFAKVIKEAVTVGEIPH